MSADFLLTIESDDESVYEDAQDSMKARGKKRKRAKTELEPTKDISNEDHFSSSFLFDSLALNGPRRDVWDLTPTINRFEPKNGVASITVDDIIARRRDAAARVDNEFSEAANSGEEGALLSQDSSSSGDDTSDVEDHSEENSISEDSNSEKGSDVLDGQPADGFTTLRDADMGDGDILLSDDEDSYDDAEDVGESTSDPYFASAPAIQPRKPDDMPPFTALPDAKLSRPLLLGLSSMGLSTPTPIQAATIPVVLLGKDVVGSSVTGSGKTVAFWVGVIERLLHRDKRIAKTRVVCICPTRELAVQVYNVGKGLARYTDLSFCLCVGGLSIKAQETELKRYPDVVISTPGRLIDHVRNTPCFTLDSLEILIIDEADRILEEGFRDELTEIVSFCPRSRSTLLFSATVSEDVKELSRLALDKPVRLKIDHLGASSRTLTQEFLRVRDKRPRAKEAMLVAVSRRTFQGKTIVFFRSKAGAHRMQIIYALLGLRSAELHGDLSQEQRLTALERFRAGQVDYLLATDLASRGLDIKGVENVINFEMPVSVDVYLHRVGRTARAGRLGRALTLVGEDDRKLVKQAVKHADPDSVKQRGIPADQITATTEELGVLENEVQAILAEEREDAQIRRSEMELRKGENLLEHADEITARAPRTWFQSGKEKDASRSEPPSPSRITILLTNPADASNREHNARFTSDHASQHSAKLTHKKRRRQDAIKDARDAQGAIGAAVRSAKKAMRPGKMTSAPSPDTSRLGGKVNKSKKRKVGFSIDLGDRRAVSSPKSSSKARSALNRGAPGRGKPDEAKLRAKIKAAQAKVKTKHGSRNRGSKRRRG